MAAKRTAVTRRRAYGNATAPGVAAAAIAVERQPSRRRVAALLFLGLVVLYGCNFRLRGAGDSLPTRVLPFSILREGNLDLNEFTWAETPGRRWPYYVHGVPDGDGFRLYSVSTIATAVIVTPLYIPAALWMATNDISYDDSRARVVMVAMEKISAAMLAALSAALLYCALSGLTTWRWALALALGYYALGTSTWSIASQALWPHGLAQASLAALLAVLVWGPRSPATSFGTAVLCAVMVWNRPQMTVFAVAVAAYALSRDRRAWVPLLAVAVPAVAALAVYNLSALGSLAGGYGGFDHFRTPFFTGLGGLTISPNRGLFIYTPLALFAVWGAIAVWRRESPVWLRMMTIALIAHVILYAKFDDWWAGYSYGPRYFTDVQPLLAVLLVYGLVPLWHRRAVQMAAVAMALYGVVVQAIGVYAADDGWNRDPVSVDLQPDRVWDWRDTQIRRSLANGFRPLELLPVMVDAFRDPLPAFLEEIEPADLASHIELLGVPDAMRAGEAKTLRLRLTNRGGVAWPMFSGKELLDIRHLVFVVQGWHQGGRRLPGLGEVVLLPQNLAPGEVIEMEMPLVAPPHAGSYDIEVRVTQAVDGTRGIASPDAAFARIHVEPH